MIPNSQKNIVQIDVAEHFPRLRHAPIVEAVIDLRCQPTKELDEVNLKNCLGETLRDYAYDGSLHSVRHHIEITKGVPQAPKSEDLGFLGVRYRSNDGLHIAQFKRDGFIFSRLAPYDTWDNFKKEACRLWSLHKSIALPVDIVRIGVRFINSFDIKQGADDLAGVFHVLPAVPRGLFLELSQFFHQDTMHVPGHPYAITVTRARQPKPEASAILDIDAFTLPDVTISEDEIDVRLAQLRWLKNKTFEGSISPQLAERLQRDN